MSICGWYLLQFPALPPSFHDTLEYSNNPDNIPQHWANLPLSIPDPDNRASDAGECSGPGQECFVLLSGCVSLSDCLFG